MTDLQRQLTDIEKQKVLKRDNYRCRYCGAVNVPFEFDHVYPHAKGGETTLENVVTSCIPCNRKKSAKVGIWPKPIEYFEPSHPSFLSGFLCTLSVFLLAFGSLVYFNDSWWGFYAILFGIVVGFFGIHTRRMNNDQPL